MNINIGGIVFLVDEDAYDKLVKYLREIRRHFKNKSDNDEIITDIESRIVELFQQKLNDNKKVITIEDVNDVINTMGKPRDFSEEADNAPYDNNVRQVFSKRLFRDIENRMLGGVCSGLGAYFRVDPIIFRIAFVVATIIGITILVYLIMWLIIPPARTIEEKLEMQGDPVTISNIEKSIREELNNIRDKVDNMASQAKKKWKK